MSQSVMRICVTITNATTGINDREKERERERETEKNKERERERKSLHIIDW